MLKRPVRFFRHTKDMLVTRVRKKKELPNKNTTALTVTKRLRFKGLF